jgi:hypothetical protein
METHRIMSGKIAPLLLFRFSEQTRFLSTSLCFVRPLGDCAQAVHSTFPQTAANHQSHSRAFGPVHCVFWDPHLILGSRPVACFCVEGGASGGLDTRMHWMSGYTPPSRTFRIRVRLVSSWRNDAAELRMSGRREDGSVRATFRCMRKHGSQMREVWRVSDHFCRWCDRGRTSRPLLEGIRPNHMAFGKRLRSPNNDDSLMWEKSI